MLGNAYRAHLAKQLTDPALTEKGFYRQSTRYIKNCVETTSFSLEDIRRLLGVEQTVLSSQLNMFDLARASKQYVSAAAELSVKSGMSRTMDAEDALISVESFNNFEIAIRITAKKDFDKQGLPANNGFTIFAQGQITSLRNQNRTPQLPDYILEFNVQRIELIQKSLTAFRSIEHSYMQQFTEKYPHHDKALLFMKANQALYEQEPPPSSESNT